MATDTNKQETIKLLVPPAPSSIPAFDPYLVPTCDDYGHEVADVSVVKNMKNPDEES